MRPRHPGLALLALIAAFLLWYALAAERPERTSESRQFVPLTLTNVPQHLIITSEIPERIAVRLHGPLSRLRTEATKNQVEAVLDLSDAGPGITTFQLNEKNVRAPDGIRVVSLEPHAISLKLERIETRSLEVLPKLQGEPAEGYQVTSVRVAPETLTVSGPGSLLGPLEHVECAPVSIEGAEETVETAAQPRLPHPLLRTVMSSPVLVVVEISPTEDAEQTQEESL